MRGKIQTDFFLGNLIFRAEQMICREHSGFYRPPMNSTSDTLTSANGMVVPLERCAIIF